MTITLDDVSCLLHLSIKGRLSDHRRTRKKEVVDMMVTYLGTHPGKDAKEAVNTRGAHARFVFGKALWRTSSGGLECRRWWYAVWVPSVVCIELLPLVPGSYVHVVDKNATYVDMVYLKYLIDLTSIHEYNWEDRLFGLPVLEVEWRLSLEDKVDDRELHAAYNIFLLLIFS